MTEYKKPKLKTPPPPEIAFLDLDSPLFHASSAGENIIYRAVDPDGNTVAEFPSAAAYKNWIEVCEAFGADIEHGYEGDFSQLTREVDYEILDVEKCYKAFDRIIKQWVSQSGCKDWVGFISKNSGLSNFRYDICTLKGYKSGRQGTRKPHHLEAVRKYASQNPKIKIPRGPIEVDDICCARAQKAGWKGCVIAIDKDSTGVRNCYYLIPDEMESPEFSSGKIVGKLYKNGVGKIVGCGWLFWIFQSIASDKADSIPGCKGIGDEGAFKMLSPFSEVSIDHLPELLTVACEAFKKSFGECYEYKHCYTGEDIQAHWRDLMEEMLHLVYMKKSIKDVCPLIEMIREIDV